MITQDKFKCYPADLLDFVIIGDNYHTFLYGGATCRMKLLLFFNLDQTNATNPL
jgi:hypothetical protein